MNFCCLTSFHESVFYLSNSTCPDGYEVRIFGSMSADVQKLKEFKEARFK